MVATESICMVLIHLGVIHGNGGYQEDGVSTYKMESVIVLLLQN